MVVVVVGEDPVAEAEEELEEEPDAGELEVVVGEALDADVSAGADAEWAVVSAATRKPSPTAAAAAVVPIRTVPRLIRAMARSRSWPRVRLAGFEGRGRSMAHLSSERIDSTHWTDDCLIAGLPLDRTP